MKMKLSKNKKRFLLLSIIGVLTASIVTPIVVINNENNEKEKEKNVQYVKKAVEILEEKSISERQIKLATDSSGNIIADNKTKIIAKIKELIGEANLKGVSIEVSIKEDKEISSSFEEIVVEISKGHYSQKIKPNKIFVARSKNSSELTKIDVNLVKNSLNALKVKTVEVYTSGAVDQKITTNKIKILEAIKKLEGYEEIEFKGVSVNVKDSNDLLPTNSENAIAITLILSKSGVSIESTTFKAKQMSLQKMANIDINFVKSDLENLSTKTVEVDTSDSVDPKITTNKVKILAEIRKLQGYKNIEFKGVNIDVKNSEEVLPAIDQNPIPITVILSKTNALPNNIELTIFSAKQKFDVIAKIENKIIDKEILINPTVSTSNQSEVQEAIKNQLKIENPSLTNNDLSKISTNISSLHTGNRQEVNLKITFNQIEKIIVIYVAKGNSYLLLNSNIVNGSFATIFQDKFKNLWAIGHQTKLQVLEANQDDDGYVYTGWTSDTTKELLKNSKIENSLGGTIFQDSFGNLWAMGQGSKLQVLKVNPSNNGYVSTGWIESDSSSEDPLLKNSIITNGKDGTIFQDSFKNLWAMTHGSKLQVLKVNEDEDGYVSEGWINDNSTSGDPLLKNSNITNGLHGTIFQDKFKNLWTMASGKKLQVLKVNSSNNGYVSEGWINDNTTTGDPLLINSNITNGSDGAIFQDIFGNLWTMGNGKKLQVLKVNPSNNGYVSAGWINDNSTSGDPLLINSNITNGYGGKIFQDSFKNLWAMGSGTKLQVLKVNENGNGYVSEGWIETNSLAGDPLLRRSNITNGDNGKIFQDTFGNLWSMGSGSKLQILKVNEDGDGYVNTGWIENNYSNGGDPLLINSNITNGYGGTIFQDSFENLWSMGNSKLQVIKKHPKMKSYIDLWHAF